MTGAWRSLAALGLLTTSAVAQGVEERMTVPADPLAPHYRIESKELGDGRLFLETRRDASVTGPSYAVRLIDCTERTVATLAVGKDATATLEAAEAAAQQRRRPRDMADRGGGVPDHAVHRHYRRLKGKTDAGSIDRGRGAGGLSDGGGAAVRDRDFRDLPEPQERHHHPDVDRADAACGQHQPRGVLGASQ
jgi:hypothetical protein